VVGNNCEVGFGESGGRSGTVGGVNSSVSWMEGRWVIQILVGPVLEEERAGGGGAWWGDGEKRLILLTRHVSRVYIPVV
jgi:hypothetical protein